MLEFNLYSVSSRPFFITRLQNYMVSTKVIWINVIYPLVVSIMVRTCSAQGASTPHALVPGPPNYNTLGGSKDLGFLAKGFDIKDPQIFLFEHANFIE